jgi:hypothetical protein
VLLEYRNQISDICVHWQCLVGCSGVKFSLEVDCHALVSIAVYEFQDLFEGCDSGTGMNLD